MTQIKESGVYVISSGNHSIGTGEFLDLPSLAKKTKYSKSHLRNLLTQQKVKGAKVGSIWISTVDAVKEYRSKNLNGTKSATTKR